MSQRSGMAERDQEQSGVCRTGSTNAAKTARAGLCRWEKVERY
jgi:hypothetical protein